MPRIFLANESANEVLSSLRPGSVQMVCSSPRYLDLVDYAHAAEGGEHGQSWRRGPRESVTDYVDEHMETCVRLLEVCTPDAVVALEVDDYRVPGGGGLIALTDLWRQMLETAGFRITEAITLVRPIAIGRRSGAFKRFQGQPGYFYPDNVTSTLLVAFKGEPQMRLRKDGSVEDRVPMAWAERFLKNAWRTIPPQRKTRQGHPVPQDSEVVRALISFYSLPGDTVLDPFAGSGTTGRIAHESGRDSILIEREGRFAQWMRMALPTEPLPLSGSRTGVSIRGSQLYLGLGEVIEGRLDRAFRTHSMGKETERFRGMALMMSRLTGINFTPKAVQLMMLAERAYCDERKLARGKQAA